MATKSTNRTINVYINDKDAGKTMKQIAGEARKLSNLINRELTPGTTEYNNAVKRLGELRGTLTRHRQNVRQAASAWNEVQKAGEGFISKIGKRTFWTAALVGAGALVKQFVQGTYEVIKLQGEVQRLTGMAGSELKRVTAGVSAISKTFGETNERVALAVKRMTTFGISGEEALSIIEKGFLSGANASGEFLHNIDEYSYQYQNLNYNANEFVEILRLQAQETYKDYGSDFLKEFGILFTTEKDKFIERIEDVNKNVERIFSQELISSIESGELGAKESMNAIITEIEKLPPNSEKARTAINRIFGTKGEDNSEAFIRALNDVTGNIDGLIDRTNSLTIIQQRQLDFQKNLTLVKQRFAAVIEKNVLPGLANMVGAVTDYIQVPYSETLRQEQTELNTLVGTLSANIGNQEMRNRLIKELQEKYPGFLKNMDIESMTASQLTDRLKEVNEQYMYKIVLQKNEEQVQKAMEKRSDTFLKRYEREKELTAEIDRITKQFNITLEDGIPTAQKYSQVFDILTEEAKKGPKGIWLNDAMKAQKRLNALMGEGTQMKSGVAALNTEYEKEGDLIERLKAEREDLIKAMEKEGIIMEQITASKEGDSEGDRATGGGSDFVSAPTSDADAQAQKQREDDLKNHLDRLKQLVAQYEEEQYLASLDSDEQELERIRLKYNKQIEEAQQLAADNLDQAEAFNEQIVQLEKLRDAELENILQQRVERQLLAKQEQFDKEMAAKQEQFDKEIELEASIEEARMTRMAELENEIFLMGLSANEQALVQLDLHYSNLLAEAESYEMDVTALKEKHGEERAKMIKAQQDDEDAKQKAHLQKLYEDQQRKMAALGSLFGDLASAFGSMNESMSADTEAFIKLQKGATLAQIAMDTAAAISSLTKASEANPANPFTGGMAAVFQFATGMGRILSNIAAARQVLAQKKEGGFTEVVGPDDGKTYNAQYMGSPTGGMLPPGPKLILANEAGQEYFVPNHLLNHPQVASHVGMIEAIRVGRQRQEGGFSNTEAATSSSSPSTPTMPELAAAINRLNSNLEAGLHVLFENETINELRSRMLELMEIQDE